MDLGNTWEFDFRVFRDSGICDGPRELILFKCL
jgi:hypothetical protein